MTVAGFAGPAAALGASGKLQTGHGQGTKADWRQGDDGSRAASPLPAGPRGRAGSSVIRPPGARGARAGRQASIVAPEASRRDGAPAHAVRTPSFIGKKKS